MAPYLFWELIILISGVWVMAVLFFVYGWLLLKRQKQMMQALINQHLSSPAQTQPEPIHLEISKDEPIAKYKDISPDTTEVSFVDKNE